MRYIYLYLVALLLLATSAAATDPLPSKTDQHIGANQASDGREGGETIADALPISSLPFTDTGATCDNIDDYDEVCPYSNSTSPDVVYSLVSSGEEMLYIDLCGSQYDTKAYVYDSGLNLVACNDDFYFDDICGVYVSLVVVEYPLPGETYYIVIDGYGGDCGEYSLEVYDCPIPPPCDFVCPDEALLEGEPELVDGYVDTHNGGCDSDPPVFQDLFAPEGSDALTICGDTGWWTNDGIWQRDTDWYRVVAGGEEITWDAYAYHAMMDYAVMYLDDCDNVATLPNQVGPCVDGAVTIPTTPGEIVYLRVAPVDTEPPACSLDYNHYIMWLSGVQAVVPVEHKAWGTLKSLYR